MPDTGVPELSFVLPAQNELPNVEVITGRLHKAGKATGLSYEIVWVDDGSTDGTGEKLDEIEAADNHVRVFHLSRNFGHMAALTAGLECARASGAVICMDADGQHPPELIPEMTQRWKDGADIVQTIKKKTDGETILEHTLKTFFIAVMSRLSEIRLPSGASDFRLLDREVVDVINALPEKVRFVRGLVCWVGYRTETVDFLAPGRMAGASKYNFRNLASLALNGITGFSTRPLRLSFYLGLLMILMAAGYAAYVLIMYALVGALEPKGWPSTILTLLILGGTQLLALGITSEYLARLYMEVKNRPVYIIRKKVER